MANFRVSGATGQAPQTSWFAPIPDRLNMLRPWRQDLVNGNLFRDQSVTCNFLNQWIPWNLNMGGGSNVPTCSFTSFTTAPDGTISTAQLMAESTSNSVHVVVAGMPLGQPGDNGFSRLAVYLKYAGRRVVLWVHTQDNTYSGNYPNFTFLTGANVIFDLANGVIGVAPAYTDGSDTRGWSDLAAEIKSVGGGWYLCTLDVHSKYFVGSNLANQNNLYATLLLDNGTGSGALSATYTGDGVSGVYGWRTNHMPVQSYYMSGQSIFFDDFLSSSTIDLGFSLQPGFNWYTRCATPILPAQPDCPASAISVAGSVMTMQAAPLGGELQSFAALSTTPGTAHVGTSWKPPFLIESRMNWAFQTATPMAMWTQALEFVMNQPAQNSPPSIIGLMNREMDYVESLAIDWQPNLNLHIQQSTPTGWANTNVAGVKYLESVPVWSVTRSYNTGVVLAYQGNFFVATAPSSGGNPPPTNVNFTAWTSPTTGQTLLNVCQTLTEADYTQFNTYSLLVLPYDARTKSPGMIITFFNGIFNDFAQWRPNSPPLDNGDSTEFMSTDGMNYGVYLGTSLTNSVLNVDWVSVRQ